MEVRSAARNVLDCRRGPKRCATERHRRVSGRRRPGREGSHRARAAGRSRSRPANGNNDESESDLDLEWAGAIAKNANILFVTASSAEIAVAYAIDNDVAPILSTSYGSCEPDLMASEFSTENNLFAQAASMGMTILAAAGNAGAADCDTGSIATHGLAVDFPASSQYVTGIGGTEFNANGATYFASTNNNAGG